MKVVIGDTFTHKYKESVCVIKYVNSNKVLVEYDDKYVSRLSKKGVRETIGRYSNKDKAIAEYDNAKEIYIKHIAEEYKSKLRKDVYNKLINWKRQK